MDTMEILFENDEMLLGLITTKTSRPPLWPGNVLYNKIKGCWYRLDLQNGTMKPYKLVSFCNKLDSMSRNAKLVAK